MPWRSISQQVQFALQPRPAPRRRSFGDALAVARSEVPLQSAQAQRHRRLFAHRALEAPARTAAQRAEYILADQGVELRMSRQLHRTLSLPVDAGPPRDAP